MLNWWLVVVAVIVALLILGVSVYFIILFTADVDKGKAWFPKLVVLCGLFLSAAIILLIPFDVAARRDVTSVKSFSADEIDTQTLWQVALWSAAVFIIVIIPFTTFYYEGYDPDHQSFTQQLGPAILYTFLLLVVAIVLLVLLWFTVGFADLPFIAYSTAEQYRWVFDPNVLYVQSRTLSTLPFQVSFFVYVVALLAFFGWLMFLVFGSVGLAALPYDYFHAHLTRPPPISDGEFEGIKAETASRAEGLLRECDKLHKEQLSRNNMAVRRKIDALKIEVYDMLDEYERQKGAAHPLYVFWTVVNGGVGVMCFILSMLWILHILIYGAIKHNEFLNTMLIALDDAFPLLGVIAFCIFAFYLLFCCVKGCLKVGVRVACVTIHPLKVGDTLMNAMLFNVGMILLISITVAHFTATTFDKYIAGSTIDTLLNVFVRYLRGIGIAMYYFQFIFPILAVLSVTWVVCCPRKATDKPAADTK